MTGKFKMELKQVLATRGSYASAMKLGLRPALLLMCSPAFAQGFIDGFKNLGDLTKLGIALLISVGVLVGVGLILGALVAMYKKERRGQDDITWSQIALQIAAGGLSMALSWVGVQVVETLGGSASDIGSGF